MPYLSLYRKYRPRSFAEIVGQRHVTQTLSNAVKADRIAHAYLFCGPRGTGKTSTARALAMALNCEKGPAPEPCGECDSCRGTLAGSALDVIEIDAASNRGIDEIRELRQRVGLAPAAARRKVYIIDEVHMLTGEAFNAFLKTLEEPPAHVVFVLATTEPHRVLPTILSRCQRFDFHRVGMRDIEAELRRVAEGEGIEVEEKAAAMLAHAADGSVRDGLTLLEQAAAYAEEAVTPEAVTEILGGIDFDLVAEFTDVLMGREVAEVLALVERVVAEGKDLRQLVAALIGHYRNLLVLRVDRRAQESLALPEETVKRTAEQAKALEPAAIVRALDLLADTDRELRFTSQPRLVVELCAVQICGETAVGPPAAAAAGPEKTAPKPASEPAVSEGGPAEAEVGEEAGGAPAGEPDLGELKRRWDELLTHLRKSRKTSIAAFLREAEPTALKEGALTLLFNHQFHYDQMRKDEKRRRAVGEAVEKVFGWGVEVRCELASKEKEAEPPSQPKEIQDLLSMFPGSEVEE
jgi:DNA polymerase-3 subunit gamma/tau